MEKQLVKVENGVQHITTFGQVTVNMEKGVHKSSFGKSQIELRQVITTVSKYPSAKTTNSLNDNLFSTADFGGETKDFTSQETRIAWMPVPEGIDINQVVAKINATPDLRLYKTLSNKPIIDDNQQWRMANVGDMTMDSFDNQIIRFPQGATKDGVDVSGQVVLDNHGKVQYRRIAISVTGLEDQDLRTAEPADFYASPSVKAELGLTTQVNAEQTL